MNSFQEFMELVYHFFLMPSDDEAEYVYNLFVLFIL